MACNAGGIWVDFDQCTEYYYLTKEKYLPEDHVRNLSQIRGKFQKPLIISALQPRLIIKALRPDTVRTSEFQFVEQQHS